MVLSIGTPSGSSATTCGYCSPPGQRSSTQSATHAAGLLAHQLSCQVYQQMIDRGWRRSGTWCYKPDLKRSCCPSYTIKLDATKFKASKSQRKLIHRWNRFIIHGKQSGQSKSKEAPFSLNTTIHAAEVGFTSEPTAHQFQTIMEPASYTQEKFELYCKYQKEIHNDLKNTPSGFKRFLVDSPLIPTPIPYPSFAPSHLPTKYGSYHQLYRCDDKLVALGVIDILPNCVSSVYFIYDPEWEEFSFGKLSALREVALASEIREAGIPDMGWLYMGFYIHSCPKMRYKGDYAPSYLADPETYAWFPLETCVPLLDKYRYALFSRPEASTDESPDSFQEEELPQLDVEEIRVVRDILNNKITVIALEKSPHWKMDRVRREILECIGGLGNELARDIIFYVNV